MKFIQPKIFLTFFTCPHCGVTATQDWSMKKWIGNFVNNQDGKSNSLSVGNCQHCDNCTLWIDEKMYFPKSEIKPFPLQNWEN